MLAEISGVLFAVGAKYFPFSKMSKGLGFSLASYWMFVRVSPRRQSCLLLKLVTHLHLEPKLRMSAIVLLCLYGVDWSNFTSAALPLIKQANEMSDTKDTYDELNKCFPTYRFYGCYTADTLPPRHSIISIVILHTVTISRGQQIWVRGGGWNTPYLKTRNPPLLYVTHLILPTLWKCS